MYAEGEKSSLNLVVQVKSYDSRVQGYEHQIMAAQS